METLFYNVGMMNHELINELRGISDPMAMMDRLVTVCGLDSVVLASSLGAEDQVLTDMMWGRGIAISIVVLDTGRLHTETHSVMSKTQRHYGFQHHVMMPPTDALEAFVQRHGPNAFYESVELRKACCHLRKMVPLKRALHGKKAWITGVRREQSVNRAGMQSVEWDESNGLIKLNPLIGWSSTDVWTYLRENQVPTNPLHDRGYPSIGCAPCTRAVEPGQPDRAGRWWWENHEDGSQECGLHQAK